MPTLLSVAHAKPVADLPGRSLLPLLLGESPEWRRYLFTEYHLHSAHNYYPQRTVRDERYKLVQNLLANEVNPGYDFTVNRFFGGLSTAIAAAPDPVREAYQRMRRPPEFELYDLCEDPYEFRNVASNPEHRKTLERLQDEMGRWRVRTTDPLLRRENVMRLKQEIDACFKDGKPSKDALSLNYVDYFFEQEE
jgi:N-sulfoglucosamine sulfohydrolase